MPLNNAMQYRITKTKETLIKQYEKVSEALADSGNDLGVAGSMAIDALLFKVSRLETQREQALNIISERDGHDAILQRTTLSQNSPG